MLAASIASSRKQGDIPSPSSRVQGAGCRAQGVECGIIKCGSRNFQICKAGSWHIRVRAPCVLKMSDGTPAGIRPTQCAFCARCSRPVLMQRKQGCKPRDMYACEQGNAVLCTHTTNNGVCVVSELSDVVSQTQRDFSTSTPSSSKTMNPTDRKISCCPYIRA